MSPKFLFASSATRVRGRGSSDPPQRKALASGRGSSDPPLYPVSDIDLASRLSFFLWSSIPDDELLDLAARGQLSRPAVLDAQVKRMLRDPKSSALVDNFAAQWLHARNLRNATPDKSDFPDFDDNLRQAFERELKLFVASIIREDRNVLDLMTADYTFVNERLAQHYGIPNVYGPQFRRVRLADDAREGPARQGRGAARDVARRPHVAGGPRQVDPR